MLKGICLFFCLFLIAYSGQYNSDTVNQKTELAGINPYDPNANPFLDLDSVISLSQKQGKNILLQVGGNWCIWCKRLEKFFNDNPELLEARNKNFVFLKVNYSKDNKNEKFLSKFPKIKGYPHIFILDKDGELKHSQDTGLLEEGQGYSKEKILKFLDSFMEEN